MKTVGEILYNKRLEKAITLQQVEKATKIRTSHLSYLENNQFDKFDSEVTVKGFIKNYANFLGLSLDDLMAFYRRQAHQKKQVNLLKNFSLSSTGLKLTPTFFTAISLGIVFLAFLGFIMYQFFKLQSPPLLEVNYPLDNTIAITDEIEIRGKTDPQATLTINNQMILTDDQGIFKIKFPLTAGLNSIVIKTTNKYQRSSVITRNVRLELP